MRKKVDDPRLMIKVCDLYYNPECQPEREIGKELGLSDRRLQSFFLDSAKSKGLVSVKFGSGYHGLRRDWREKKRKKRKYGVDKYWW